MFNQDRIICSVSAPRGETLPRADDHPFWLALDDLSEAIAAVTLSCGHSPRLVISSDAPAWVHYFWVELPHEQQPRREAIQLFLAHVTRARHAWSTADWSVTYRDHEVPWDMAAYQGGNTLSG